MAGARRWPARHPALTLGLLGLLGLGLWQVLDVTPEHSPASAVFFAVWTTLLRPFAWVATAIAPVADRWPGWLDGMVTAVAGLVPYMVADHLLGRVRRAGFGNRSPRDPS
ncbi:MAG TPA: hypothetical protein VFS40_09585 [Gemmatimonadales bacterium]|nr:hypothetical protein [Gemmatimonadales bacterium]